MRIPPPVNGKVTKWVVAREYVTRNAIDRWREEQRFNLAMFQGADRSKLRLIMRGRHRVDDLGIETISPTELPDTSQLIKVVEKIPLEKRAHLARFELPELKPGESYRNVWVTFFVPTPDCPIEWFMYDGYDPAKYSKQSLGDIPAPSKMRPIPTRSSDPAPIGK